MTSAGRNITGRLRHDVVISQSLGLKLGLGEGDQVQVRVDSEVHELTVAGVADDFSVYTIYLDIKRLSSIVSEGRTTELYTGIYSIEKPSAASTPPSSASRPCWTKPRRWRRTPAS